MSKAMIVEGDNKFELFAQLFEIGRVTWTDRKDFTLMLEPTDQEIRHAWAAEAYINGIEGHQLLGGDFWILTGYLLSKQVVRAPRWVKELFVIEDNVPIVRFKAIYSVVRRKGTLFTGDDMVEAAFHM